MNFVNLLPWREKYFQFIKRRFYFLFLILLILFVLSNSYFYLLFSSLNEKNEKQLKLENEKAGQIKLELNEMNKQNENKNANNFVKNSPNFVWFFSQLEENLPESSWIDEILFKDFLIEIKGFSLNRDELITFYQLIQNKNSFYSLSSFNFGKVKKNETYYFSFHLLGEIKS